MMLRIVSCFTLILICSVVGAQTKQVDIKSGLSKLRIVKDVTPPTISLTPGRPIEKGFSYIQKDPNICVSGTVTDVGGLAYVQVNGIKTPVNAGGHFFANVALARGTNRIQIRAVDKKGNPQDTTFIVYQDPTADTTAPVISITQPSLSRGVQMVPRTPKVTVRGMISDDSPMSRVTVNDVVIDSIVAGHFQCEIPTDSLRTIMIKAVDSCGNVSFDSLKLPPFYFSGEAESLELPVEGKYYALIIGVQKYRYMPALKNPVNDARKLAEILTSKYVFDQRDVVLLTDPTRTRIIDEFEKMKRRVGENDNLLVFYAGHGSYDKDSEQGFWWPSDAATDNQSNWISNSDIRDQLKRIKSRHTFLIADACFSGRVFERSRGVLDQAPPRIIEAYQKRSRRALTSGQGAVPDNSVFTRALFSTLESNSNRYLRTLMLTSMVNEQVVNNSETLQDPEYGPIIGADDNGGDFVFIRRVQKQQSEQERRTQ
jgi:hypothetical protein